MLIEKALHALLSHLHALGSHIWTLLQHVPSVVAKCFTPDHGKGSEKTEKRKKTRSSEEIPHPGPILPQVNRRSAGVFLLLLLTYSLTARALRSGFSVSVKSIAKDELIVAIPNIDDSKDFILGRAAVIGENGETKVNRIFPGEYLFLQLKRANTAGKIHFSAQPYTKEWFSNEPATLNIELREVASTNAVVSQFEVDSATVPFSGRSVLEKTLAADIRDRWFLLVGRADRFGRKDHNIGLGQSRALSLAKAMESLGVPRSHIIYTSVGAESPIEQDPTTMADAVNRGVELFEIPNPFLKSGF